MSKVVGRSALLALLAASAGLIAQGLAIAEEPEEQPPPVTEVELRELPNVAKVGRVATYRGEADRKGVAFYIPGLGIGNPVTVMLVSGDKAAPMRLALKNDLSADWDRKVDPDEAGVSQTRFRTEGPAMALVTSPGDLKPYQLMIWVGPEIKIHRFIKNPFHGSVAGGSGGKIAAIMAGVLALLLIVIVVVVRKKRRAAQ